MAKKLVIVESPAKARTIKNFLGSDYEVEASIGHIRDLAENKSDLPKELQSKWWADYSVDIDNDFEPKYIVPREKQDQVRKLKAAMQGADTLVLATDEDREGESISWHLLEVLKPKKDLQVKRIAFHEITKEAIQAALQNPREVDQDLVRAQETRRILDRLYGYTLSPVLWRLGRGRGLSAGRVQSPAVKLIVERELERRRFKASSYWDLKATLQADSTTFDATLVELGGRKIASGKEDFDSTTGELKNKDRVLLDQGGAESLAERARQAEPWTVLSVEDHPEQRRPYAPFMTSTLQQEANRKLGFAADRTMRIAQDLYEGIAGAGLEGGLITYMRTDSVVLSDQALGQARQLIEQRYGKDYLPEKPVKYSSKVKNAQEAHEAIRPTDVTCTPEYIASRLQPLGKYGDHIRLYELIWKRTVACQMKPAELLITSARIGVNTGEDLVFAANGKAIKFPGFLRAYVEGSDDPEAALEDQERVLPVLKQGQTLQRKAVEALGHETRPPARYTDASLVKALEDRGIGRPSTYATIIKTIVDRDYVRKQARELVPTFMAFLVTEVLDRHFSEFSDLGFTAQMDRVLDEIASGNENWKKYLREFFLGNGSPQPGLKPAVEERLGTIRRPVFEVGVDPETEEPIVVHFGRNGFFVARGEGESAATATVPDDLAPADLTVEKARELIRQRAEGPQSVGIDPLTGRRLLLKNKGGYYLEVERTPEEIEAKVKPRWISVPPGMQPSEMTQEILDELSHLPKHLGKHPESGSDVFVKMGKYGAYVESGIERRTVEDWRKALDLSLSEAVEVLAQPKGAAAKRAAAGPIKEFGELEGAQGPVRVLAGRFGPYVTDGTTNATLPKDLAPEEVTAEKAVQLLQAKAAAGPSKKRFTRKSAGKKRASSKKK